MTSINVSYRDLGKFERRCIVSIKGALQQELRELGSKLLMLSMQGSSDYKIYDLGKYVRGWRMREAPGSVTVENIAPHALYIEMGRRAGARMPPLSALYGWIERKGIPRSAAWPIARAIGKRGISARPVFLEAHIKMGILKAGDAGEDSGITRFVSATFDRVWQNIIDESTS